MADAPPPARFTEPRPSVPEEPPGSRRVARADVIRADALSAGRSAFVLCLLPILAAIFLAAHVEPFWSDPWLHFGALGVAGAAWWVAIRLARSGSGDLKVVVAGAIALRLLALVASPDLSDDVYRYAWEGELVSSGISPYASAPEDPRHAELAARIPQIHARVNHPEVSAAYPPVAQLAFAGVVRVAHAISDATGADRQPTTLRSMRVFFTLCDLACLIPLVLLLRRTKLPASLAVAWGWSPLIALEFGASAHFDSLGILFLLGSLAAFVASGDREARGGREFALDVLGGVLLGAAIWVKLLPLCVAPFALRGPARWLRAAALLLSLLALATPVVFWTGGTNGLLAGLSAYGLRWEAFSFVYVWIEKFPRDFLGLAMDEGPTDPRVLARSFVLLLWVGFGVWTYGRTRSVLRATTRLIAAFLVLTPTLHPWYLAWMVPFLALRPRESWLWVVFVAPLLYVTRANWVLSGDAIAPDWLWLAVALPFLVLLACEVRVPTALRRRGARHRRVLPLESA